MSAVDLRTICAQRGWGSPAHVPWPESFPLPQSRRCPLCSSARWYRTAGVSPAALGSQCHTVEVARQLPMMGARCWGEQTGNPLFPNRWGLGACLETVQTQQIFGKFASSAPGEVSDAWDGPRTALRPLAGHGWRSACAAEALKHRSPRRSVPGATPGSGAEAVPALCRSQSSPLRQ